MIKAKKLLIWPLTLALLLCLSACTAPSEPENASIAGGVFFDCDMNGECESGDCGIEDIHVRLYQESCGGDILRSVYTDEEGKFEFLELIPGEYCVFLDVKFEMCGYGGNFPTNAISRKVTLEPGNKADLTWFGLTKLEGEP